MVGSDTPEYLAKSDWDQPNRARAAFSWLTVTKASCFPLIEFLLTGLSRKI